LALYTRNDTIATNHIYQGHIFDLRVDTLKKQGSATEVKREVIEHSGGVVIACKPAPDEVLLIRQYRYALDEELIELPAGRVNKDEDRLEAAKRELIEETGFKADRWQELPPMYSAPGFCTELLTFYIAEGTSFVGKNLDHDEETDVMRVTLKEAWQLVLDLKIRDCKTVAALGLVCR
jgi:ADP-ribose pyrophosphatase